MLVTAQAAQLRPLADLLEDHAGDREVAAMAQAIARRLAVRRRRHDPHAERGTGTSASMPYRYQSDELDLDRTIEVLAERPRPEDTDIVVRERMGTRRAVALVVDVSGSMRDEKVRIAAATMAALSADLSQTGDQFALIAFWSDAAVLKPMTVRE
ncbi:VWA domain-containing protein [Saccharomonospora sp. NPDC046836]|uniref:VWA domain-containing protein n=1 Tax=Saccharomonospora sp. NPDC046836 TaxID=3156921 RepID=UPI0033C62A1A